jgi:hypothetical protein
MELIAVGYGSGRAGEQSCRNSVPAWDGGASACCDVFGRCSRRYPTAPAAALAKEGFAAFALATHAVEGRPPVIERFPLEYCFDAVG